MPDDKIVRLRTLLAEMLGTHPGGLSEHEIIKRLGRGKDSPFHRPFSDSLSLFRAHFLLFHALYGLREQLWRDHSGHLEISPLRVILRPYRTRETEAIAERDPLRDYYMDLRHLEDTTAEDVETLLDAFWLGLDGNERRREALAVLGLEEPVDFAAIKRRYRRLAMEHHPDRGGDKERLQAINGAMAFLTQYYS
jgi:hypothetical protein